MDTIRKLEKDILVELKERLEEFAEVENGNVDFYQMDEYDIFHEIADSNTPIYNSDIIQLAADNLFLALDEPELGPAFDGSPTPINIIAANIYEYIQEYLLDNMETIKAEITEEMLEDEDDES